MSEKKHKYTGFSSMRIGLVVMACCCAVLSGCRSKVAFGVNTGRVDKTRASIESTIDDPEQRAALQAVVESFEQEMKGIESEALAVRRKIKEANADYDTTREELDALYGQINTLVVKMGECVKRHSLAARARCSEEEWEKIMGHKTAPFIFEF